METFLLSFWRERAEVEGGACPTFLAPFVLIKVSFWCDVAQGEKGSIHHRGGESVVVGELGRPPPLIIRKQFLFLPVLFQPCIFNPGLGAHRRRVSTSVRSSNALSGQPNLFPRALIFVPHARPSLLSSPGPGVPPNMLLSEDARR